MRDLHRRFGQHNWRGRRPCSRCHGCRGLPCSLPCSPGHRTLANQLRHRRSECCTTQVHHATHTRGWPHQLVVVAIPSEHHVGEDGVARLCQFIVLEERRVVIQTELQLGSIMLRPTRRGNIVANAILERGQQTREIIAPKSVTAHIAQHLQQTEARVCVCARARVCARPRCALSLSLSLAHTPPSLSVMCVCVCVCAPP